MATKELKRDLRREALTRMEEAARTVEDFNVVTNEWDLLDSNRERKERYYEIVRPESLLITNFSGKRDSILNNSGSTVNMHYYDGKVFPIPYSHIAWREAMKGDFLSMIYDKPEEMWQIIEDWVIAFPVKALSKKQADVLYLCIVHLHSPQEVAFYQDKTDRAVRKLLAATLESIRSKIAPRIREQIKSGYPQMTLEKRIFIEWYDKSKGERK